MVSLTHGEAGELEGGDCGNRVQFPRCTSLVLDTGSSSYGRSLTERPCREEKTGESGKEQHELLDTALQKRGFD